MLHLPLVLSIEGPIRAHIAGGIHPTRGRWRQIARCGAKMRKQLGGHAASTPTCFPLRRAASTTRAPPAACAPASTESGCSPGITARTPCLETGLSRIEGAGDVDLPRLP